MKQVFGRKSFLLLFILFTAIILGGCGYGFHYSFSNSTNTLTKEDAMYFTVEKEVVEPITELDIHTRVADIELIPSDNYYVEINYTYWEDEPEYTLKDGKLSFDDSDAFPNSYSINFNLNNYIRIYLPKNTDLSKINLENASGDITANGFHTDNLNINLAYGDLSLEGASAIDADIDLASGSSKISDFESGDLEFNNSYGNAKFTDLNTQANLLDGLTPETLSVNMASGKVTINGLNFRNVEISNSYGDVTCEKATAEDFDLDLSSGDLEINDSNIQDIQVNNSYGDVTMNLPGPANDYSLDLKTSYGDVTVDDKSYEDHLNLDNSGTRTIDAELSSGDVEIQFNK